MQQISFVLENEGWNINHETLGDGRKLNKNYNLILLLEILSIWIFFLLHESESEMINDTKTD